MKILSREEFNKMTPEEMTKFSIQSGFDSIDEMNRVKEITDNPNLSQEERMKLLDIELSNILGIK